jgi:pantothenate kinase
MDSSEITEAMGALRARLVPGTRTVLGIAGAPGSGKSTFAEWIRQQFEPGLAVVVPMDGFHLGNVILDGTPLRQRKGAIDTFDAGGYLSLLRRLVRRDEPVVYAPEFRRSLDEPVAASIAVPAEVPLVITEGNYLLVWPEVRALLDAAWYVDPGPDRRLDALVARHIAFGKTPEQARLWVMRSDERNADLIDASRSAADLEIGWTD